MPLVGAAPAPMRNRLAAAAAFFFTFLFLFVLASSSPAGSRDGPQVTSLSDPPPHCLDLAFAFSSSFTNRFSSSAGWPAALIPPPRICSGSRYAAELVSRRIVIVPFGIRYGKYCGVGWTGCPGEKPCDEVDACCKVHDDCVGKKGMTNVKCHQKFKTCVKKVQKSGKLGFSKECPYEKVVPTMVQGMDMAIMLSQFGNANVEL
ncbi:unnamed protein product [Linum tenue]|uniref:Phospholipase A(2) n=1 Tax=Linum tenue TaxID=586396 RepID=A0AAV0S7D7_9ROSI|nr:unnamed protein product [Linum tenue]